MRNASRYGVSCSQRKTFFCRQRAQRKSVRLGERVDIDLEADDDDEDFNQAAIVLFIDTGIDLPR